MEPSLEKLIKEYQTPPEVIEEIYSIPTVVLTGITAAGKDTIIGDILEETDELVRVVTSTTRGMRENNHVMETEGNEYYFLTLDQAIQKINNGEYIEVAPVHGQVNGSLVAEFRRISGIGKTALMDVNFEGVEKYLTFGMKELSVYFVMPPSFEIWLARLMKRQGGTIGDREEILRRFRSAQVELKRAENHPQYIPIINDVSRETAHRIVEYTRTHTGPTPEERAQAIEGIQELNRAISNYIEQLEGER